MSPPVRSESSPRGCADARGACPPAAGVAFWLRRRLVGPMVCLAALTSSTRPALAQTHEEVVDKLRSDDPRVRAAAALQLGATGGARAVEPLCRSLEDRVEVVRIASATALRRLKHPSSVPCLKARLTVEPALPVKLQISRALSDVELAAQAQGDPTEPSNNPNAKYYVALSPVSSAAERPVSEVEAIVLRAARRKLESVGNMQLAPARESPEAASAALAKRRMKGFYLAISVDKFDYTEGNLRVKVNIAVFTYPAQSLVAPMGKAATMSGVNPNNRSAEDQMLAVVAEAAVQQFADNVGQM